MANGDQINEWVVEATVETTDATVTVCGTFTLPTGTEGAFVVESMAHGQRSDAGGNASFAGMRIVTGFINGGTLTLKTPTAIVSHNPDASAYATSIGSSGAAVRVSVTGTVGHTIRWQTWMRIRLIEQTLSF